MAIFVQLKNLTTSKKARSSRALDGWRLMENSLLFPSMSSLDSKWGMSKASQMEWTWEPITGSEGPKTAWTPNRTCRQAVTNRLFQSTFPNRQTNQLTVFESVKTVVFRYVGYIVDELRFRQKNPVFVYGLYGIFKGRFGASAFLTRRENRSWNDGRINNLPFRKREILVRHVRPKEFKRFSSRP